jgi:galactose mutarotase-like enzyme
MELQRRPYGTTPEGAEVELFTLKNSGGVSAGVITYGCIITSVRTPDRAVSSPLFEPPTGTGGAEKSPSASIPWRVI